VESVRIVDAYRTRAIGFEELARRTSDAGLKRRLTDLAQTCVAVADAIERNPGLVEIDQVNVEATLH
jgi:hypothetical protein